MASFANILPVYIVADESGSLGPQIEEINQGLESLLDAMRNSPLAAAKIRLSIIGFAEDAEVRLHLADVRQTTTPPLLQSRGASIYGAAFSKLRDLIPADLVTLKSEGYSVHRPAVFFLSDGQPSDGDGWRPAHQSITDRSIARWAPTIIACGVGDAEAETMLNVATSPEYAFVVAHGVDIGPAVSQFCLALTSSVVASGKSLGSGAPHLVVQRPGGFLMAIDVV
ncbi:hypothetical protein [Actinoplanes sp. DH11]|uniref:vWA domain-containing protein n=1 Tax=Actinoplanes sp. DH11 TaxID=2857011 RepID=UPI001E3BF8E0|nr:hypothetical protein [Actinoplanes sp. DH11]